MEQQTHHLPIKLALIENDLECGQWLCGDAFSLADISVLPFVERFHANGYIDEISADKRPRLADWFNRIQQRSAVIEAYAFADPDRRLVDSGVVL